MHVPLQYQVSEYDCVPTAFINAVGCLFERHEVPPMVVRHIYTYSLDTVGRGARLGRGGTSKPAVHLLGHWLGAYKAGRFSVTTEYLDGDRVHVGRRSPILGCLEQDGVALLNIRLSKNEEHFVTTMGVDGDWLTLWDPYCRTVLRGLKGRVQLLPSEGRSPNLAVRLDWLDGDAPGDRFTLGPRDEREALLIWRNR